MISEQHEDYHEFIKNEEKSIIEIFLKNECKTPSGCFKPNDWRFILQIFEDVRHGRWLILLVSLSDEGILKKAGSTDYELFFIKSLALEKLRRQRTLKECIALH